MALVLSPKNNRKGEVKSFTVVRAEEGDLNSILEDIKEGEYKVLDGTKVTHAKVSYRTVQDIETV